MRFSTYSLLFIVGVSVLQAGPIALAPGSLLVIQPDIADFTFTTANTIAYSRSGSVLGTGRITGTSDIAESVTVLNGSLFVSDGAGKVNQIDLSTGAVASAFATGTFGLDALGSLNGNLLAMTFSSTAVRVFSTGGVLRQSIGLASLPSSFSWDGLASDGTILYLADVNSGRIYEYATTGVALGSFATGAAGGLLGLSYDASNNSLWVNDISTNRVIDFSTGGIELSEFSTGSFRASGGLAVVPGNAVPEPRYTAFLFIAMVLVAAARRLFCMGAEVKLGPSRRQRRSAPRHALQLVRL